MKVKTIFALLAVAEFLIIGFRWMIAHSTLVGMISMTSFTLGSVGKTYIERTQVKTITIKQPTIIKHDSFTIYKPIHDTLVKEDSIYLEKIVYNSTIKHDTFYVNNELSDTIKGIGLPIVKGDTVILNFTHTNPHVHEFKNYVYTIRPHKEKYEIHVTKDTVKK